MCPVVTLQDEADDVAAYSAVLAEKEAAAQSAADYAARKQREVDDARAAGLPAGVSISDMENGGLRPVVFPYLGRPAFMDAAVSIAVCKTVSRASTPNAPPVRMLSCVSAHGIYMLDVVHIRFTIRAFGTV